MKSNFHIFRTIFREYQWIHLSLGIIGNISFFVGSIFFLYESLKDAGVWLFIIGSFGMLIGSLGSAIVKYEEKKQPA
ncbi:hypothetical protein OKW21_005962 [Catalinimonas alkaloidigena]|uniref:YrhK family protein n=1 Tax=Catalinimonas alkaloidigena TaxID=1075417 RepID=UPI00240556C0|nr:YrhK family protein [Catalinimonas alkaloidigena]MDF9800699.1 hypothetical protein [Catalinimonas alkaloidigena]